MTALLSCPDSPQLLQNPGKRTFKPRAPVQAVYANNAAIRNAERTNRNLTFIQHANFTPKYKSFRKPHQWDDHEAIG